MQPTSAEFLATAILNDLRADAEAERLAAAVAGSHSMKSALLDGLAAIRTAFSYPADQAASSPGIVIPQLRNYPYAR